MKQPVAAKLTNHTLPTIDPFKQQLKNGGIYLAFSLVILGSCRALILFLIADWQNTSTADLASVLFTGLRFDLKVSAVCLILFVLLPILPISLFNRWHWLRNYSRLTLFTILLITLFFSYLDIGFYFFFGTEISNLIFGIVDDGTYAVLISIFSDWRLVLLMFSAVVTALLTAIYFLKATKVSNPLAPSTVNKGLIWLITILLIILCGLFGRGSLDTFPLSRRTTVINDNPTINSLALNGPYHFYYAYKDYNDDSFSNLSRAKTLASAKLNSLAELKIAAGFDRQHPLLKTSGDKGPLFTNPNVIFVLMEGWSSHIALADNPQNQVLGEMAKHIADDYFFQRFFSDKYGTNPTIESLLLNTPIGPITQSAASKYSFSTSNLLPFKRQNYQTLFLSGGNSAWRKHGQFWPRQGFDQYLGRATIEAYVKQKSDNPWGVYDSHLFEYLQKQLTDHNSEKPLFSFVLTTNNHPPIKLPSDYLAPPLAPEQYGFAKDNAKTHQSLTGYHFQSNALGEFMTWLKQSKFADNTIVVATGDHVLKGFANYSAADQAYNRYAVPVYFYLPPQYDQLAAIDQLLPGSHKDLFPTLFELALNREQYLGYGTPLMHKEADSAYGSIDQGGYIFSTGVSTDGKQQLLWKPGSSTQLSKHKKPLSAQQLAIIQKSYYLKILQKYLLIDDVKKQNSPSN